MAGQSFHIRIGERDHRAHVQDPQGEGNGSHEGPRARHVSVDGELFEVQRAPGGMLTVRRGNGARICVTLDGQVSPASAHTPGQSVAIEVQSAQAAAFAAAMASGGPNTAAAAQIKAPMPGRVVRILVAVGDTVDRGTPVLIIEAMKMENEMHAAAAGIVAQITVVEGDTVDPGQLLCLLEIPETAAE